MQPLKRYSKILEEFSVLYPNPKSELDFEGEYQLIVAVMLSAQCTDKKVNQVTPTLFEKFPSFEKLAAARATTLESIIRPINYYKTKAKHLALMAKQVIHQFGGTLPKTLEKLILLPGVGRKTASVILSELGTAPALPVDTHVFRVSRRLEIATGKNVTEVEESLKGNFLAKDWRQLHHWLIFHGRRVCKAQRPLCEVCAVEYLCPKNFSGSIKR